MRSSVALNPQTNLPQFGKLVVCQVEQFLYVCANACVTSLELLVECRKTKLQSEIRLNDTVVNVVCNSATLLLCCIRCKIVDEADVFHHRSDVVHQLQHEIHVRTIETDWTIDYEEPANSLVTIVNRYR